MWKFEPNIKNICLLPGRQKRVVSILLSSTSLIWRPVAENGRLELGFGGFRRNGSSDFQCEKKKGLFL